MEKITLDQVQYVAMLARLEFRQDEMEAMAKNLSEIVQFVEKLDELDLDGVPETAHVLDLQNVFREDKSQPSLSHEEVFANAPARNKNFFSVPKVIG